MNEARPAYRYATVAAIAFFWLLSVVPLALLFFEFSAADSWFFARLYSPLFIYPVSFGLISAIFLIRPIAVAVERVLHTAGAMRNRIGVLLFAFALSIVGYAFSLEMNEPTEALWSIGAEKLKSADGQRLLTYAGRTLKPVAAAPGRDAATPNAAGIPSEPVTPATFSSEIAKLSVSDRSRLDRFYVVGFIGQAVLFLAMFLSLCLLIACGENDAVTARHMGLALFIACFWPFLRMVFLHEKGKLYAEDPLLFQNYVLVAIFILAFVYLVVLYWPQLREKISVVTGTLSAVGIPVAVLWKPEFFAKHLGGNGQLLAYVSIFVFFAFVAFPFVLRKFFPDKPRPFELDAS